MQMTVQAAALTPLCDDGKVRLSHEAHEQQNVDVACLSAGEGTHQGAILVTKHTA